MKQKIDLNLLQNIKNNITNEQIKFLKDHYVYNGYFRTATLEALKNNYPELYSQLLKASGGRYYIAECIENILNLKKEENPKCILCGKPALWNNLYYCYRPTCGPSCGTKLSYLNLQKNLNSRGVENSSQLKETQRTKNNKLYDKIFAKLEPEFTLITSKEDFNGNSHWDKKTGKLHWSNYQVRCNKCGTIFDAFLGQRNFRGNIVDLPVCPTCVPRAEGYSLKEVEVRNIVNSLYSGIVLNNTRSIIKENGSSRELDIYLPNENLAIEFDGLAWHSDTSIFGDSSKANSTYHLNKTLKCENKHIKLLHIFEDEWDFKKEIVISIIKHNLKCKKLINNYYIKYPTEDEAREFFIKTNIFGYKKADIFIGLYSEELQKFIAISSYNQNNDLWEFIQFSQDLEYEIENAFQIIFDHIKIYVKRMKLSVDRRYFNGSTFKEMGFNLLDCTRPKYFYTDRYIRSNNLEDPNFKKNIQISKIYDCGSKIFLYQSN